MQNSIRLCSGVLLAFVAGYIDTATFLGVSELFSAHITGNFVVFAIALVHGVRGVDWLKLIALPVFFIGVPLATFLYDRTAARIRTVLICEAALLGGVGLLALFPQVQPHIAWLAMALVLAMAFQNAAHQLDATLGPTSAVMTTNSAKLFVALWRKVLTAPEDVPMVKADGIGARIIFFAGGCAVSAFATHRFGLASVLLPAALVGLVAAARRQ